jgi:hypothetical protein
MKVFPLALSLLTLGAGCAPAPSSAPLPTPSPAPVAETFLARYARELSAAHGGAAWHQARALEADLTIDFGGQRVIEGQLLAETTGGRVRLSLANGTVIGFDGREIWTTPADSAFPGARFHALTWSYFLTAPFKVGDPGTQLEELGAIPFTNGETRPAARLTFGAGVGDSPEDWYVLYRDPVSGRLAAMAYIVTFGKTRAEGEKEPHGILYQEETTVGGVTLATRWVFSNWSREAGFQGAPLGGGQLSNLKFVEPAADAFSKPADSRLEPRPGG